MKREMEHIAVLAGDIGFRVATTPGEQHAANYIEQEFQHYGLQQVRQEAFACSTEAISTTMPYLWLLTAATCLTPFAPLAALGGLLAAPAGLLSETRLNRGPVTNLTRTGTSHNVIGILPARATCRARVVLMAHYDSVRVRGYMNPRRNKVLRRLPGSLVGLAYMGMLLTNITHIFARQTRQKRLLHAAQRASRLLSATALAGLFPILGRQLIPGIDGEGANDNASGVAVLLSVAEELAQTPLEHTEVWFVATGGEEVGLVGARTLLQEHEQEISNAYFFAIDTVGAGRIHYTTAERFTRRSAVPHEVLDILVAASEAGKHGAIPIALHAGSTDASAALDRRYKAASICCLDDRGQWPEINWPTDTRSTIKPQVLSQVTAFTKDILQEINRRVCYNKLHKNTTTV